jgi:chitinase
MSGFAAVLDYVSIMNYDIFGSFSSTAGPNAPLNDTCIPSSVQPQGSALTGIAAWKSAGFPSNKIVLGVPSYGHTFSVSAANATSDNFVTLNTHPGFDSSAHPLGGADAPDANEDPFTDQCGVVNFASGLWEYSNLVNAGFIEQDGTFTNVSNVHHMFDNCSQTVRLTEFHTH